MLSGRSSGEQAIVPSLLSRLVPELDAPNSAEFPEGISSETSELEGDEAAYIHSVERDILWLFNTSPILLAASPETLRRFPYAASSVLAYGLRHIFERFPHDMGELQRTLDWALQHFEPRLKVETTSFKLTREGHLLEIELKGSLLAHGGKRSLRIRTDLQTFRSELKTSANLPSQSTDGR